MTSLSSKRELLYRTQRGKCHYCRFKMIWGLPKEGETVPGLLCTVDHLVPVSKGGGNNIGNLVAACFQCNGTRGNVDANAFAWFIARYGRGSKPHVLYRTLRQRKALDNLPMWNLLLIKEEVAPLVLIDGIYTQPDPRYEVNEPKWRERRRYLTLSRRGIKDIVNAMPYHLKNVVWGKYLQEEKANAISAN